MKKQISLLVIASLIAASLIGVVSADAGDFGSCPVGASGMYGMMSGSYGFGGLFFGWLFGLLVVVALILLIVWLIKQIQKK